MKAVFNRDFEIIENDGYVGCWYQDDAFPQDVELKIYPDGDRKIDYNGIVGGGHNEDEYNNKVLVFTLPSKVYSIDECELILEELKEIIDALVDSYDKVWVRDSSCYRGIWDEDLERKLREELEQYESELIWGELEGEDEEEE